MTPDDSSSEQIESPPIETVRYRVRPRPDLRIGSDQRVDIRLEVVGGPMDGVTARVSADELTIGRGVKNDLLLVHDPLVSARHARIVRDDGRFLLEDLGSQNGTYIGDQRIQERTLIGPGTVFILGSTCLEFMPE
jgi:pSer/pThr/pTyr-binding forkhead associated (FHA) protein